jgi:type IV pilus assembly protein PilP
LKFLHTLLITLPLTAAAAAFAGCGGGDEGGVIGPNSKGPSVFGSAATAPGSARPPQQPQPAQAAQPAAPAARGAVGADAGAAPSPTANLPPLPTVEFTEADFVESEQNRDPFRSFAAEFLKQARSGVTVQRKVLIDRYALEELKLVGIVTRAPPRALLTDPSGLGWVAKVGDFVGKPEIVHAGGPRGADVAINWRVDRIREGDVVFIREDPSHPEIPTATRVLALRTDEDKNAPRR